MTNLVSPNGTPASRFSFGTMQFGGTADEHTSRTLYDACRAHGINFFDTAFGYTEGRAETLLGRFAARERDDLIIATKVGYTGGAGAANIQAQFDTSRQRLAMDYVDILYLHRFDTETPLAESLEALAMLHQAGQIGRVGVSNFAAWQIMKARHVACQFGLPLDVVQPMYNLVKRQAEVEILPKALSEGLAVVPYSPLGGGLLTGKYTKANASGRLAEDSRYNARYGQQWMRETAAGLLALAADMGANPATLAVAWAAHNPAVFGPILSARSVEQLEPSLRGMTFEMDAALYARVSALSVTPPPATDRLEET